MMREHQDISIVTTTWSELPREQNCRARHESGKEVRERSSRQKRGEVIERKTER